MDTYEEVPSVATKNGKNQKPKPKKYINSIRSLLYLIIKICPKGHTELIIGASRAK